MINLLSNAIKYNKKGGEVIINCVVVNDDRSRISIIDSGEGIPEEKVGRLFEPFDRLDHGSNIEGTGIGLTVSKKLTELMNGKIGYTRNDDGGSIFWVELPRP